MEDRQALIRAAEERKKRAREAEAAAGPAVTDNGRESKRAAHPSELIPNAEDVRGTAPSQPPIVKPVVATRRSMADTRVMVAEAFGRINREMGAKVQHAKENATRLKRAREEVDNVNSGPQRVSFLPATERVVIWAEKISNEYRRMLYTPELVDSYNDPYFNHRRSGGEEAYAAMVDSFSAFPEAPTPFQWKIFQAVCSANAPTIIGPSFFNDPERWIKLIGGRYTDGIVGILTGRKTGKSTGLAYVIICLLFVVSAFKCVVSSKILDQAKIILTTVRTLIHRHPWFKRKGYSIFESRATCLSIRGPDGTIRTIESKCGNGEVRFSLILYSGHGDTSMAGTQYPNTPPFKYLSTAR